jgi:hypothetical protein
MMKRAQRGKTRAQRAKKSGLGSAIPVGFHHWYSILISIHLRITPPKTKSRAASFLDRHFFLARLREIGFLISMWPGKLTVMFGRYSAPWQIRPTCGSSC